MTFAGKLKMLRNEKGWSQEKLGKIINIHPRLISKYEMGKNCPAAETLIKIARAFRISIDYLLIDEEEEIKPSTKLKNNKLLELFEELEKMTDKDQETIISLIDAYIAKNKK